MASDFISKYNYVSIYQTGKRKWEVLINGAKWMFYSKKRAYAFFESARY